MRIIVLFFVAKWENRQIWVDKIERGLYLMVHPTPKEIFQEVSLLRRKPDNKSQHSQQNR